MGIFGNSFKRELGKNTAKRVSNAIFGDKWSTPYKRVSSPKEPSASSIAQREHNEIQREKNELKRRQLELMEQKNNKHSARDAAEAGAIRAQAQRATNGQMWELDSAVIKNVDAVIAIEIPATETELENLTLRLCNQMSTEHWCKVDIKGNKSQEGAIRDKFVDAVFSKFSACLTKLSNQYPDNPSLPYLVEQKFNFEQRKRDAQLWPMGNNHKLVANIAIPCDEYSIEKLLEELSSHYTMSTEKIVQCKFKEALSALEKLNPDNEKVSSYYKYHKKIIWGHRWKNNKTILMWTAGIIVALYLIGFTLDPEDRWIHSAIYILLALVFVVYPITSWYMRKRRLDSYRKSNAANLFYK